MIDFSNVIIKKDGGSAKEGDGHKRRNIVKSLD